MNCEQRIKLRFLSSVITKTMALLLRSWIIELSLASTANGIVHKEDNEIINLEGNLRIKSSSIFYLEKLNLREINGPV